MATAGMGDVLTLVEKAQDVVDEKKARRLEAKLKKNTLNLEDFMVQLKQLKRMGPLKELLGMIPGMGKQMAMPEMDGTELTGIEAMIQSMSPAERTSMCSSASPTLSLPREPTPR